MNISTLIRLACSIVVLNGCGGDSISSTLDPSTTLWEVRLDEHAVTMATVAPGNTLQLRATANAIDGTPMPDVGIRYSTRDSAITVTTTGLVTARFETRSNFAAVASIASYGNVTVTDTVYFRITDTVAISPLSTFSIQRDSGNNNRISIYAFDSPRLFPKATNARGDSIADVLTYFTSSNPAIASVVKIRGYLSAESPGAVTMYGSTLVYGVKKRDSVVIEVTYPVSWVVNLVPRTPAASTTPVVGFEPPVITIARGGVVTWYTDQSVAAALTDIVFDDSAAAEAAEALPGFGGYPLTGSGNIPAFIYDSTDGSPGARARRFNRPGVYTYRSTVQGTTGKIIVP